MVVGAVVAACGGYSSTSGSGGTSTSSSAATSSTASNAAACQSAAQLRTSLTALKNVDVVQQGTDATQQAFATVKSNLQQLISDIKGQYAGQTAKLEADVAAVQTTLDAARADKTTQTLGALRGSVQTLVNDASALVNDVSSKC